MLGLGESRLGANLPVASYIGDQTQFYTLRLVVARFGATADPLRQTLLLGASMIRAALCAPAFYRRFQAHCCMHSGVVLRLSGLSKAKPQGLKSFRPISI